MLEQAVDLSLGTHNKPSHDTDWQPLYLFNLYRLTIAVTFTGSFIAGVAPNFLGGFDERLFLIASWIYLAFTILSIIATHQRWLSFNIQVVGQALIDIVIITVLMHASGGVNSGLGMLLVIAIAGGSLLTGGDTAFLFAASASLCVLIHVTLADIYQWFPSTNYTHAGMLGATFFATAFLAHKLAQRIRINEELANQRGVHLQYLAQLNSQIVQNIQSGIIVVDVRERIHLFNEAAQRLLRLEQQPSGQNLAAVVPELAQQMAQWRATGKTVAPSFRLADGEFDLIPSFTELNRAGTISLLIMLEDAALTTQRAQQLKLAALGRLTASIAHEVRNPLGAISHAGQLLAESSQLSEANSRLVQIIVNQSQRVNTIIESVLQLSRREQANTQSFDLCEWLHDFTEEFMLQHGLTSNDCILHLPKAPIIIRFDRVQLYQVLTNICENGLRYSQNLPLLKLTASNELAKPSLDICDQGIGMNEEIAAQIFEPFFTTESKGTGLGLYIAREICEANQASLQLIVNENTGCCFRIYFAKT